MLIDVEYLKKYNKNVVIISNVDDIKAIPKDKISNSWRNVFLNADFNAKRATALAIWENAAKVNLRNTIAYLKEFLIGIDIIEYNEHYSVLYTIKNNKGSILYYEGRLNTPQTDLYKNVWTKFPPSIQNYYELVHDGFFYYASQSMGLSALEDVINLDELEWGIIEELQEPLQIKLDATYGFFTNGMGTYVAIDITNCSNDIATLWSAKKQPKYNINFWDLVDEWIVIGFQN